MDVSIIIVNYNTRDLLKQCINSVFEKTHGVKFEMIVVDNASSDGSQKMIKENFPYITLIESSENLGFGRANNLGFEYAKGRNIFLLNSDTILLSNAVKILSDYLDCNSQVGVCGGNLFNEKGYPTRSFSRYLPSIVVELSVLFGDIPFKIRYGKNGCFNYTNKPLKVGYISGADLMLRSSILSIVGGFDTDFFLYFEETELEYRVIKSGFSIYSIPNAHIMHLESRSFNDNYKKVKLYSNSHSLYYKKTHGKIEMKIIRFIFLLTIYSRIFLFKLSGNNNKLNYWKLMLQNYNNI
jgi:GT2 family glycosyltransferase